MFTALTKAAVMLRVIAPPAYLLSLLDLLLRLSYAFRIRAGEVPKRHIPAYKGKSKGKVKYLTSTRKSIAINYPFMKYIIAISNIHFLYAETISA
jgi:hypothetical protein